MEKIKKIIYLSAVLILTILHLHAQEIGGKWDPLLNSVHTYQIPMGDISYTPNWGLYPSGTLAGAIEDGSAVAYTPGVDYDVIPLPPAEQIKDGASFWKIQFNRNINENQGYVIGYKETTADGNKCLTAVVRDVMVHPPFDVDVALNDDELSVACSENSGVLFQSVGTMQTEVVYKVFIEHPADDPGYLSEGGRWSFKLNIKISGVTGNNGSIASIDATDRLPEEAGAVNLFSVAPALGTDEYTTADIMVNASGDPSATVTPVYLTVVYNEVLGESQNIELEIFSIYGSFEERDIDEVNNTREGNNIVRHTKYAMPAAGDIIALN
ncbi:hypothetical protein [Roseimarinus sediminis]|uniref:hypothetical protein n=1 Tax=Roseimarinus sediminis TaxID=1610899 RepID=UPI003D1CBD43